MSTLTPSNTAEERQGQARSHLLVDLFFIFLLCFLFAGGPPPNVNEAHYLGKAKHYWNPEWCSNDFFLNTKDAHLVFNWVFGWVTLYCSLPMTAWIGRCLVWSLWSLGFVRLSRALFNQNLFAVMLAGIYLSLLHFTHMAGEWVIGGVEAKVFAHALVLLGLAELVKGRWKWVWPLFGLASSFHVIVGGWAVVAAMLAALMRPQDHRFDWKQLPYLVLGGLLALPGLIPGILLTRGSDPEVIQAASQIYVYERISHHLVPLSIYQNNFLRFLGHIGAVTAFVVLACGVARLARRADLNRLSCFVAGCLIIAAIGGVIDVSLSKSNPAFGAQLLRFYWFRMSDATVPLAIAMLCGGWLMQVREQNPARFQLALAWSIIATAAIFLFTLKDVHTDPRPGADRQLLAEGESEEETLRIYGDWLQVCAWINENTPEDAVFLTPYHQQTFKWYANRSEVANWKDVPQDATQLVLWWDRVQTIYFRIPEVRRFGLLAMDNRRLYNLCNRYKAQFIVVDRRRIKDRLPFAKRYPAATQPASYYEVYQVLPYKEASDN